MREEIADVRQCLQTISRRSDGFIRFVTDFRNPTSIVVPQLTKFDVAELLKEVKPLMREQLLAN
ncbi:hypothetical protein ACFSKU_04035 [Pontibacter silvestris]|uniref:Uncharacterized protein n=1 Tax=Pontibacter silvestris TaxID=2305183 RepID=A0ABW4WVZ0_9BACT|nr:hypothetical protein [Pontibacter silvestris]MCC9137966.1 hypothetical protein [Pontibacter silvestris]